MLKSLTVSNFKAFKEPVTIDFSTTGNYTFNTEAVKDGIVKTAVMYGKNASGKSSLGLAIFDIVGTLTDNYISKENYANYENRYSNDMVISFEYTFSFNNRDVVYSYTKSKFKDILSEKLRINDKILVDYNRLNDKNKIVLNMKGAENTNLILKQLNFSILRFIKSNVILTQNEENELFEKMYDFVSKMLLFWSLDTKGFVGYTPVSGQSIIDKIVKENHFADLQKFFKDAGFEDELDHRIWNGAEQLMIKYGNDNTIDFNLAASSGMRSLLLVYYWLEDIADPKKCPSFIFIDEFDAFYHFELSYFIIERLKSYGCQVLLTTHNTSIFTNDLLRPDCYYICSKDKIVNAHNATLKELRYGHNLEKLYRGGTFGK
ncbi:MAG: AAA family ATPase [Treponema sp.]|uniref:AAA family ATPase n=1 Tax=Treponema sp. TaxID=166 RepID=UPI0025E581DE|nr:AAA family ATPase [Treponema sp.]MBR0495001.1 AAA family ATPase [Treponema sp.]